MLTTYRNDRAKINRLFDELKAAIAEEDNQIQRLDNAPLGDVIDAAGYCRDFYKELDEIKSSLGVVVNKYSAGLIPKRILDMAIEQNRKFEDVKTQRANEYRATVGPRCSVSLLDEEKAMNWLKENGHGDIIKETANSQTLGKLATELESDCVELPDELFKVSKSFSTTLTRHKPER